MSIFSNSSHLEWRVGLSDLNVKGTLPARFGVIWFSGFRVIKLVFVASLLLALCIKEKEQRLVSS